MPASPTTFCFTATLVDAGAIPVTFDQRAIFGRARPPVIVEINGYHYRSTIAVMNGASFVPLRRSHREAAGVLAGATIEVTLTLDTAPREVTPPDDLANAIHDAAMSAAWDRWSFTRRREAADGVESARRPETRRRRIAAIVAALRTA